MNQLDPLDPLDPPKLLRCIGDYKWQWGEEQVANTDEDITVEETFTEGNRWKYMVLSDGTKQTWNLNDNKWVLKT